MKTVKEIIKLVDKTTKVFADGIKLNIESIDHIVECDLEGAIVECGVWRGGSMAAMMHRMADYKDVIKDVYLFDTFAGMTEPTDVDIKYNGKRKAKEKFDAMQREDHNEWCYASLDDVKATMEKVPYPANKIHYIEGDVLETTFKEAENIPQIALLRIDVDFYEGTKACLEALFPNVVSGGIVIFDDYGIWNGAKKAIDEFFEEQGKVAQFHTVAHNKWCYKF